MWKRVWKMDYISAVSLLQRIFGPSLWMREQVSVPRFMNSQLFSCIRSFSDVSMLSSILSVLDSCKEILTFFFGSDQDWIMEQWEKNYYISSIAGATNGSSLVIMSKGL